MTNYIKEFARFLIHPHAVSRVSRCAWNSTSGWNRQLACIHEAAILSSHGKILAAVPSLPYGRVRG
ncbi:MAG: hypothetical protein HC941_05610 [Microcoleus sp. SU_5_3]|nr:hypothetical protein [Microcoleus sp. SU_5_3]